jgi:hypothetical protein
MRRFAYLIFVLWLAACGNKKHTPEQEAAAQPFFPIADYINGQLQEVKKKDAKIVRYTTINGVTSSKPVEFSDMQKEAAQFTSPDITQPPLSKNYKEASFADQSVPNITLTYSTQNRSLEIQRVDVILEPDPEASDKVKTIYFEKQKGNRPVKLLWTADSHFQIISNDSGTTIVKYVWNLGK